MLFSFKTTKHCFWIISELTISTILNVLINEFVVESRAGLIKCNDRTSMLLQRHVLASILVLAENCVQIEILSQTDVQHKFVIKRIRN